MMWAVGLSIGGLGGAPAAATVDTALDTSNASYAIADRATGADAERLVARALLEGFEQGLELVAVTEVVERDGGARSPRPEHGVRTRRVVALELDGSEKRTVRVVVDRAGRVRNVEVRVAPGTALRRAYRRKADLAIALGVGRVVHGLVLEPTPDRGARLVGSMRGGRRFAVYLRDFELLAPPRACDTSRARM